MADEVAVFVDLENLRYGLLNNYGQEPDFMALVEKAKKHGRPSVMRAYADFSEHPPETTRKLQVAGVECINVPVKKTVYSKGTREIERIKNAADMVLALDAILEAVDADANNKKKVFFIVTGDGDYVKLVTNLRNRFGQRVVICGVPGSIARDLVMAADAEDHVDVDEPEPADPQLLKSAIVGMVKKGPAPLSYWTLRIIDQWTQNERQNIPGTAKERRDAIGQLVNEGVLFKEDYNDEKRGAVKRAVLDDSRAKERGYI